jgi:hypothetical protein
VFGAGEVAVDVDAERAAAVQGGGGQPRLAAALDALLELALEGVPRLPHRRRRHRTRPAALLPGPAAARSSSGDLAQAAG